MKPNEEQSRLLTLLEQKNREIKIHRLELKARLEEMLQKEASLLSVEQSQLANRAYVAGVSKTRIGRAMGTTNWNTVNDVLALTNPDWQQPEEVDEVRGEGWSFDRSTGRLTLTNWKNRHKRAMDDSKTLVVPLVLNEDSSELDAKNYVRDVREPGVDVMWWVEILGQVNALAGHHAARQEGEESTDARGYEELVRNAALNRDWEEED